MIKLFHILLLSLIVSTALSSQNPYANEWINTELDYYKFQSKESGWIEIPVALLTTSGLENDPANWKLFTAGEQVPLYIPTDLTGEQASIGFYGTKNDGAFDKQLFKESAWQAQPEMSLYSDFRSYYLVHDMEGEHLRLTIGTNTVVAPLPDPEPHFYYRSYIQKANAFAFGEPGTTTPVFGILGEYSQGECWASGLVKENIPYTLKIPTEAYDTTNENDLSVNVTVIGRNRSIGVITDKAFTVSRNGAVKHSHRFRRFDASRATFRLRADEIELGPSGSNVKTNLLFEAKDGAVAGFSFETKFSITNGSIYYPRLFDFNGHDSFLMTLDISEDRLFEMEGFAFNNSFLLDLQNRKLLPADEYNDKQRFFIEKDFNANLRRPFLLFSLDNPVETIEELQLVQFADWAEEALQGDFILLYNSLLKEGEVDEVQRYIDYRESLEGGSHSVAAIDIAQLYDQFAQGINLHPLAIKNFLRFAWDNWETSPHYLLLVGKSISYEKCRFSSSQSANSLVPSFGNTPSDAMLVARDHSDYWPEMAVGRLPVQNASQLAAYLNKLIQYESLFAVDCDPDSHKWMQNVLHISKGYGDPQTESFANNLLAYEEVLKQPAGGMEVVANLSDAASSPPFGGGMEFKEYLENGLALINFFGHGVGAYWEYDINTDPTAYNLNGRYPIFLSNACSVGDIHNSVGNETMVEDYLLAPESGTVGFLASTGLNSAYFIDLFTTELIQQLNRDYYNQSFANAIKATIQEVYDEDDIDIKKVCTEVIWTGDPALKMYSYKNADFDLEEDSQFVTDSLSYLSRELRVSLSIKNHMRLLTDSIGVQLTLADSIGNFDSFTEKILMNARADSLSLIFSIPRENRLEGHITAKLEIEPEGLLDHCRENNEITGQIYFEPCPDCELNPGIDDLFSAVKVYPNPVQGSLHIAGPLEANCYATVFDAMGQQLLIRARLSMENGQASLSLKQLPAGNYHLLLELDGRGRVFPFVKE
ncbi:C25 family cysteine peptidase [Chitinophagales bacterium]|nr:C25 family cysteine peptidase [Chitinophagales bacterium]